jgi:hypothetical protein
MPVTAQPSEEQVLVEAQLELQEATACSPDPEGPVFTELNKDIWRSLSDSVYVPTLGAAVADVNLDGWLDIYLPRGGPSDAYDRLIFGGSDGPVSSTSIITSGATGISASFADYDADGDPDLFIGNRGVSELRVNDGTGVFTPGPELGLEETETVGSAWGDIDGDQDLDLLVCNRSIVDLLPEDLAAGQLPGGDGSRLFLQENGDFIDVSERLDSVADLYPYVCSLIDLDGDADLDLYMVNDFGPWSSPNRALWNDGKGFFKEEADPGLEWVTMGMGLGVGSFKGNSTPDLLVSSWGEMLMLESMDGQWIDTSLNRGIFLPDNQLAWGVELADLDNDADLDAVIAMGTLGIPDVEDLGLSDTPSQPDILMIQDENGQFTNKADEYHFNDSHSGRGVLTVDMNQDGFLDILLINDREDLHWYQASCSTGGWLKVALEQTSQNHTAIGARVEVELEDGTKMVRWVMAGGTSLGSSVPPVAHFGLGEAKKASVVRVIWPDGTFSEANDVPATHTIKLTREVEPDTCHD